VTADVWLWALIAGFGAGFLDSIVGGGGLILTPAMLNLFPEWNMLSIIATQRTSSMVGTSVAAYNYLRATEVPKRLLVNVAAVAFIGSILGVLLAKMMPDQVLKTIVIVLCVALALYVYGKPDFGGREALRYSGHGLMVAAAHIALGTGFYNGLIGPGTGIIMLFAFVVILGFEFLKASALSKVANVAADFASWSVLWVSGFVVWSVALPLIIGNVVGSYLGSRLAVLKGSRFVRAAFLLIVCALVLKLVVEWLWK
jgi:hypothetical protein